MKGRWVGVGLGAIIVWALVWRAWFAWIEPQRGRFYDERFAIPNAHHALAKSTLLPIEGYYPSLSYLPHLLPLATVDGIGRLTDRDHLRVLQTHRADLTPAGYRTVRLTQALFGLITIALVFRIGRRLFGVGEGLLAALLVASVPWHVRQSAAFKPDIVMLTMILLAFDLAISADRSRRWRTWLAAGAAIGLAASAKPNALPIALPLTLVALFAMAASIKAASTRAASTALPMLGRLLGAGVTAIVTLVALNPMLVIDPSIYSRDMGETRRVYERFGRAADTGHLDTFLMTPRWMLDEAFFGPVVGGLCMLGAILMLVTGRARPARRRAQWLLVSFMLAYPVAYAAYTTNPRSWHNLFALVPFLALAGAWLAMGVWRSLARRLVDAPRWRIALGALLAVAAVLGIAGPGNRIVYRWTVPSIATVASPHVAARFPSPKWRYIVSERPVGEIGDFKIRRAGSSSGVLRVDSLIAERDAAVDLRLADALVFPRSRLDGQDGARYRELLAPGHEILERSWWRARGPDVVIVHQRWRQVGAPRLLALEAGPDGRFEAPIDMPGNAWPADQRPISFSVWVWGQREIPQLTVDDVEIPLLWLGKAGRGKLFVTPRLVVSSPTPRLTVRGALAKRDVSIQRLRWRPGDPLDQ